MSTAEFEVSLAEDAATAFAHLSGDWNPLHTDPDYAAGTRFRRPILHGAYLVALVSRMAGMHLPGRECLLHSIRIRFLAPVQPPVRVTVNGRVVADNGENGQVEVRITEVGTGTHLAEAAYEFSRHQHSSAVGDVEGTQTSVALESAGTDSAAPILVTGASGALGRAVAEQLGDRALRVSRSTDVGADVVLPDIERWMEADMPSRIGGIVHCGWPAPDNDRLLELPRLRESVEYHVASPLRQTLALGQLLKARGVEGATLVLVGSTAAEAGRHNYRMPLYTLAKSLVPVATRVLGMELAPAEMRCIAVTLDVVDGGMNEGLSARSRIVNADRSPFGRIPTPVEAADQIVWVLDNPGFLAAGATLNLTGGAMP